MFVLLELNTEVRISDERENKRKMCILMAKVAFKEVNISCNVMQKLKKLYLPFLDFFVIPTVFYFAQVQRVNKMYTPLNVTSLKKTKTQTKTKQKNPTPKHPQKKYLSSIKHIF